MPRAIEMGINVTKIDSKIRIVDLLAGVETVYQISEMLMRIGELVHELCPSDGLYITIEHCILLSQRHGINAPSSFVAS